MCKVKPRCYKLQNCDVKYLTAAKHYFAVTISLLEMCKVKPRCYKLQNLDVKYLTAESTILQ